MTLRTLPVAVHPGPDETFHSWATRLSTALDVEPLVALHAVGYIQERQRHRSDLSRYGITLTDEAAASIARTTRCTPQAIRGTLLTVFDGGPVTSAGLPLAEPDNVRRFGLREWIHMGTTTGCPECLEENGYQWQLQWRLPWTPVCVKHQVVHVRTCPGCGHPLNAGSRPDGTLGPTNVNYRPATTHCSNSVARERSPYPIVCGRFHADLLATPCAHPAVLAAQARVDTLFAPDRRADGNQWWQDLRTATATVLAHGTPEFVAAVLPDLPASMSDAVAAHYGERDSVDADRQAAMNAGRDFRTARRTRSHTRTPVDPALIAPAMTIALAILDRFGIVANANEPLPPDIGAAASDTVDAFAGVLVARRKTLLTELQSRGASEQMAAAAKANSGYDRLITGTATPVSLDTRHIPRLWPPDLYDRVRHLFPGTTGDYARQALSLAAAKIVTGGTWAQAAHTLGCDRARGIRCANSVTSRLAAAGTIDQVHDHVRETVRTWAALPPGTLPDYRTLTAEHSVYAAASESEWQQACRDAGIDLKSTGARLRNYAAWKWHTVALMPLDEWPGWASCRNVENAKEVYRRFARHDIPRLFP